MKYFKITPSQAASIGRFEYAPAKVIDPFVAEQTDGSFILNEKMLSMLQANHPAKAALLTALPEISFDDAKLNLKTNEL